MTKIFILVARGPYHSFDGTGHIICATAYKSRDVAERNIPAFRSRCIYDPTRSDPALTDLADCDSLKITVRELTISPED